MLFGREYHWSSTINTDHLSVKDGGRESWAWENKFLWVEVSFNRRGRERWAVAAGGSGKMLRKGTATRTGRLGLGEAQGRRASSGASCMCLSVTFSFLFDFSFSFFLSTVSLFFSEKVISTNLHNEERSLVSFQQANWSQIFLF